MGAEFRVVGVSREVCRRRAASQIKGARSTEEFMKRVEQDARAMFEGDAKPCSLAAYDVPQAAVEFARMARAQPALFRDVRIEQYRKTDQVNPQTGKPIGQWEPLSVYTP